MGRYIAQGEVGGFLDSSRSSRFAANPDGANCMPVWSFDSFKPEQLSEQHVRVFLFSKPSKEIKVGDELLFDYPWL